MQRNARETNGSAERRSAKQQEAMLKSRSGRPVKAKKVVDDSETEDEEEVVPSTRGRKRTPPSVTRASEQTKAKRQRWVPHNPLLYGKTEDDSSKDIQISDDDDSGDESIGRSRRRSNIARQGPSVPVRDESGRFAGARMQTEQERQQAAMGGGRGAARGGGIFKNAAVQVLRQERKLMSTGEIARLAMKRGYVKVQGRTPEATMASAMYTDVKRKEDHSLFIRPHEGLFGLREWIDEGIDFLDPAEAQPSRGVQRSRLSNPTSSKTSNRLAQKSRSLEDGHINDDFTSQATSRRGETLHERDARLGSTAEPSSAQGADGRAVRYDDPTPFGDHGAGPHADLFKPPVERHGRNGFTNVRKRSVSGSLPTIPAPSNRRAARKSSLNLSPQNSGHMSLLLDAVDMENRTSSLLLKPAPSYDRRLSGILHPQTVHPRTESGYNIFGNKPLPFQNNANAGAEAPSALGARSGTAPISHEEAFSQLEASFVSQPLQISNSLLGPLPASIPPLNLNSANVSSSKEQDGSAVSTTTAPTQIISPTLAPKGMRIPGSAFQVTGPPQMPTAEGAPQFGPPEEGVKRIPEIEAHVQNLESTLGVRHPRVGKGYLYLSRVYQIKASSAPEFYIKAQQALTHAYEICYAGQVTPKGPGSTA